LQEDSAFSFTLPNISCKINSNPDLYKIAYYNRQKKITNNPPPPSTSFSNTTTFVFAPPNSNYPQPNPVQNSFTNMPQPPRPDIIPTNNKATSFHQYSVTNDISCQLKNL
ncbi:BgTH12-00321, partial [Blumeria graminis f. sp. triticale]